MSRSNKLHKKRPELEYSTHFSGAYDKRSNDPKKDYGIGSVRVWMMIKGAKGVVHFNFSTGMLLPETMRDYIKDGRAIPKIESYGEYYLNKPMGYDVGYHAPFPQYDGAKLFWPTKTVYKKGVKFDPMKPKTFPKFVKIGKKPPKCEWLGVPCYCDGSSLRAETYMDALLRKGSEAVWPMLEADYDALVIESGDGRKDFTNSAEQKPRSNPKSVGRGNSRRTRGTKAAKKLAK